jgi:Holliday junction resolvase RusA-like endonuclease
MDQITFTIPGDPVAFARSGGNGKVRFTPKRQRDFAALVKLAAHQAMDGREPLRGPVCLEIEAHYLIPTSWPKRKAASATWRTSKPDADNVAKLISDSINEIVFVDDAQVAQLAVRKVYGSTSRTLVTIAALESGGDR